MAGKKRSKFEYSQQNKENWDWGKKVEGEEEEFIQKLLSSGKPGESGHGNIINSDKLTSLIMKLMEIGIACL